MKARREVRAPDVKSRMFWFRITPRLADQISLELSLYGIKPSLSELVAQLIVEGLAFRRMHRPGPKSPRPKGEPLPPELLARLER